MSIPPIQNSVLSYLRSFDLACVALIRDRRLIGTRDPAGHEMAWWLRAVDVGRVIKWARANSGDVPRASAALGVQLVEHSAAVQRAQRLVAKLDTRMAERRRVATLDSSIKNIGDGACKPRWRGDRSCRTRPHRRGYASSLSERRPQTHHRFWLACLSHDSAPGLG
jgi:hypothetical protein